MAKARAAKREILVINQIAQVGLKRFPAEKYAVVKEANDPEALAGRRFTGRRSARAWRRSP